MTDNEIASIDGVAFVERIDGADAAPGAPPALLVEVPHGADRRAHYDALRDRLVGDLPADLHAFFHVNTDVGAWDYGRRVAERVLDARPDASALLVRCLIPRTFVDTNRLEDARDELGTSGITAGVAPYVRHADDIALLLALHRSYVALVASAYELVCGNGGLALTPHTYAPVTVGIERVDDDIVHALRAAYEPEALARWPVRSQIDFITSTPEGTRHAPAGIVDELLEAFRTIGFEPTEGAVYKMHPSTQGMRWAVQYPERVLCLEVRRDLLVEAFTPFDEMRVRPEAADRIAAPIAAALERRLPPKQRTT